MARFRRFKGQRKLTAAVVSACIGMAGLVVDGVASLPSAGAVPQGTVDWVHQLGAQGIDVGAEVGADSSGNSYVAGYTDATLPGSTEPNAGVEDIFMAKYSAGGSRLWVHQLGTTGSDIAYGIAVDSSGNSYIVGRTFGTLPGSTEPNAGSGDVFVVKYDTNGLRQWVHQLGTHFDEIGFGIGVDNSGNSYVTGQQTQAPLLPGSTEPNAGGADVFVAKYDTDGARQWVHQLGSPQDDTGTDVEVDSSGNSYITGYSSRGTLPGSAEPNAGGNDVFVVKYDTNGVRQWVHQLGTTFDEDGSGIAVDSSGNSFVTGSTFGTLPGSTEPNAGSGDAFVVKYDTNGLRQWVHQLGTPANDTSSGIGVDDDGNNYIAGSTTGTLPGPSAAHFGTGGMFVAKYDKDGSLLRVQQFGSSFTEFAAGIRADAAGNGYVTGATYGTIPGSPENNSGSLDAFVTKISEPSSTALLSSANPATWGQTITLTANVSAIAQAGWIPTGTVTFIDGSTTIGTGSLIGGSAHLSLPSLRGGLHLLTASYSGDAHFSRSTSADLYQVVNAVVAGTPLSVSASAGPVSAQVTFSPPADDGGTPILSYTVTAKSLQGGPTVVGSSSPITVIGLTEGVSYLFTVTATNAAGTSAPSAPSNSIVPAPANRTVSVSWTASEASRLNQMAPSLATNAAGVQKVSTYISSFLLGFSPPTPQPQVLPPPGTAVTYTDTWTPNEFSVLDRVKDKFVLNDADATRFSTQIVDYLLALGGH